MTKFLLKGLIRDRHRSLFPVIIVTTGVMISVLMYCFMLGMIDETVRSNARLDTGHVKIMTRGYNEISSQFPNDLAIMNIGEFPVPEGIIMIIYMLHRITYIDIFFLDPDLIYEMF